MGELVQETGKILVQGDQGSKAKALKESGIFILVTFAITFAMNALMAVAIGYGIENAAMGFAGNQMLYPALVVMGMVAMRRWKALSRPIRWFFGLYGAMTVTSVATLVLGVVTRSSDFNLYGAMLLLLASVILLVLVFKNTDGQMERMDLTIPKPRRRFVQVLVLFFCLYMLHSGLSAVLTSDHESFMNVLKSLGEAVFVTIPMNLIFGWLVFFGEELGWRGYLQPRMQKAFGNRLGIILLGIVWGLWHAPLCFMLYSPKTPIMGVVGQVAYCIAIGIFIGYAYLKTKTLWAPMGIHLINNCIGMTANPSAETVYTWKLLLIVAGVMLLIYAPFLKSKVFEGERYHG